VASAEKAIRDLGWRPKYPKLEDIVALPGPGIKKIRTATRIKPSPHPMGRRWRSRMR
jgi:hypothetical protein